MELTHGHGPRHASHHTQLIMSGQTIAPRAGGGGGGGHACRSHTHQPPCKAPASVAPAIHGCNCFLRGMAANEMCTSSPALGMRSAVALNWAGFFRVHCDRLAHPSVADAAQEERC